MNRFKTHLLTTALTALPMAYLLIEAAGRHRP